MKMQFEHQTIKLPNVIQRNKALPNGGRGYEVQARKGRCVFFTTTFLGLQEPHPFSLHGAMPLIKGRKYVANCWFRQHQRWAYKTPEDTDQSD